MFRKCMILYIFYFRTYYLEHTIQNFECFQNCRFCEYTENESTENEYTENEYTENKYTELFRTLFEYTL